MDVRCTKNTGFYGMGSPIELKKNGEKWIYLNHNQTKELEVTEDQCTVQVSFFLLKSEPLILIDKGQPISIEITMNPILVSNYVILFIGMLLVPVFHLNIFGILFLLVAYIVFLFSMFKKAYIIKETH